MSHIFTIIVAEDESTRWEWCIRCGALRLNGELMRPGPQQTTTLKGTLKWRHSGDDYHYYKGYTVIGPREGIYHVAGLGKNFKRLKDAKAFVEKQCRPQKKKKRTKSSSRKNGRGRRTRKRTATS